ncbi:GNAT family N-acetyltransferase [Enterococcus wangshanyuanii]|uniref:N-acetyltransferase n=1 Tax=Enterococcus wangshanyuanii TaxID=2005703 RepID=A0ABQ1P9F2_9ENTE|nr:GNAT family N-acetyltransferase [Enterococcus wangshanyuanii]GGC93769.1 N-acetyltransferase [Enterococcus wangshanyuanii]
MTIRVATKADIQAINRLNTEALQHEYPLKEAEERLAYILSSPANQLFVKEIAGQVVGYIQLSEYICTYGPILMNVLGLAVDEAFRHQGIGKGLLKHGEQWAKDQGAQGLRLNSGLERTEAHKFYRHEGYEEIKKQINFRKLF